MHGIDSGIISLAITIPLYIGFRTKTYVKGVSDFLSSGRVAGGYVLAVSSGEAAMGLISLLAMLIISSVPAADANVNRKLKSRIITLRNALVETEILPCPGGNSIEEHIAFLQKCYTDERTVISQS